MISISRYDLPVHTPVDYIFNSVVVVRSKEKERGGE